MRFLFVADFTEEQDSGAAGTLIAIAGALQRAGHAVDLVWKPPTPPRIRHGTLHRLIELPRRQLHQVKRCLDEAPYDVVIVSQPYGYPVFERLPHRYRQTAFLNRTHGWEARLYEAQLRFGWDRPEGRPARPGTRLAAALTRRACLRVARSCHGLLAASSRCAEYVRRTYRLPSERVTHVSYGLEPEVRPPSVRRSRSSDRHLLFVGNYIPLKGTRVLERVLPAKADDPRIASLTFVVNNGAMSEVEGRFRAPFGDRLTVRPWMDRRSLASQYAAHDVLLFPSLFEGFGKVWLEAMAWGMCVVGFAEGGLPDLARHEREALFVPPGDTEGFRRELERVLGDPAMAHRIGQAARVRVADQTWDHTAAGTVEFCERIRHEVTHR
jgi:glycosyltransferase involved in cell wall biosynthesis